MSISLPSVLKDVLIIPYDKETIDKLSDICQTYSCDISLDNFEACMLCLCQCVRHDGLVSLIENETQKSYPDRVFRALSGFIISQAMENEDLSNQKKVIFSLLIKNVMVFSFKSSDQLIKKCISPQYYTPFEEFRKTQTLIGDFKQSELYSKMLNARSFNELGCSEEDIFPIIQRLARENARASYYKEISQIRQEENEDDFSFSIRIVDKMRSFNWEYVDSNPVITLKESGLKTTKGMSLKQIKSHINPDDISGRKFSSSSILLRFLFTNDKINFSEYKMNPLHFSIALFYEWMFESLKECYL